MTAEVIALPSLRAIAENQFLDCETGESWLWTPEPGQAKADRDDALNYLLDGTTTRVVR